MVHGFRAQLALGLFYLEHERWADADKFFTSLHGRPIYLELGELGHAIALAFQDQTQESLRHFRKFHDWVENPAGRKMPAPRRTQLLNQPALRRWIARALDRDAEACAAAKQPFPAELERWRKPLPLVAPKPSAPKAAKGAES
jgi:hypothetical protein